MDRKFFSRPVASSPLNVEQLEERILLAGQLEFVGLFNLPQFGLGQTAVLQATPGSDDVGFEVTKNAFGDYVFDGTAFDTEFNVNGTVSQIFVTNDQQTAALDNGLDLGIELSNASSSEFDINTNLGGSFGVAGTAGNDLIHVGLDDDAIVGDSPNNDNPNGIVLQGGEGDNEIQIGDTGGVNDADVFGNVDFDGGSGNDLFTVNGNVFGHSDLDLGHGTNFVNIAGPGNLLGRLDLDTGSGNDTLLVDGIITGSVNANVDGGDNLVDINGSTGALTATAGAGNDELDVNGTVDGHLTGNLGSGANEFDVDGTIGGNVTFNATTGDDNFDLDGLIQGNTTVNVGDGNNLIEFNLGEAQGNVAVNAGAGNDGVDLQSMFGGNVAINLGAGNNQLDGDGADISGSLIFASTSGDDLVDLNGVVIDNNGGTTDSSISTGDGIDNVSLFNTDVTGNLNVLGGAGDDFLQVLDPSNITGNLALDGQAGDDFVALLGFADGIVIGGDATLKGGSGNDDIVVDVVDVGGNLNIDAGSSSTTGTDELFILEDVVVDDNLTISFDGNLNISQSFTAFDVGDDLSINGNGGILNADLNDFDNQVGGNLMVNNGGVTRFEFLGDVGGSLGIQTGDGNDTIELDATTIVNGDAAILTGGGQDNIDYTDTTFFGDFLLRAGDGNDTVDESGVTFISSAVRDGGSGSADEITTDLDNDPNIINFEIIN